MFLTVSELLDPDTTAKVQSTCDTLTWRDGRKTAGAQAKAVKQNLQADTTTAAGKTLLEELHARLASNEIVRAAARPKRFSKLLLSRTEVGGGYGPHVDNAIMGSGAGRLRTDISFTLFLSKPETYDGGALMIDLPGGVQSMKPAAGDLVLYPSSSIHWVEPVTAGVRLAAVGWIESLVPDPAQREILFDLENARAALRQSAAQTSPALLTLDKVFSNLLRQWSNM
ncbi:MAG: Fe2+-dependent dioxygenase [Pseudomonadota bacterium]